MCCLRYIYRVKWQDKIPNIETLNFCWMSSIQSMLIKALPHLVWTLQSHGWLKNTKSIFYGQLNQGTYSNGGQCKQYKDTLKSNIKASQVDPSIWETTSHDRPWCQHICHITINSFEAKCINALCENHEQYKARIQQPETVIDNLVCNICNCV